MLPEVKNRATRKGRQIGYFYVRIWGGARHSRFEPENLQPRSKVPIFGCDNQIGEKHQRYPKRSALDFHS